MLKFDRIVVLSAAFVASIFCAGGSMLFAVIPEESYVGKNETIKCEWLSILDDDIENNEKFKEYREYKDLIATQSDGDWAKKFVRLFVSSLYKNLSDSDWWYRVVHNLNPLPYTNVHNLNLSRLNNHFLYHNKAQVANLPQHIAQVPAFPQHIAQVPAFRQYIAQVKAFPQNIAQVVEAFNQCIAQIPDFRRYIAQVEAFRRHIAQVEAFRRYIAPTIADLREYIDNDVEILTDFLLKQMSSSDKSIQNASYLKEAIRRAFAEKKISLKGLSALSSSLWIEYAMKEYRKHFSVLKIISEKGGFFCGKFADAFQELFIEKIEKDWCFRKKLILFKFFNYYTPSPNIEEVYGLQAFRIYQKRKELQTFSEEELSELSRRITCILKKRNIMLHTILMTVPPKNVEKVENVPPENVEKVEKIENFFYRMTEIMEDVRDDADSLLDEYKRFSDSQYWKIEKHFDDDEAKKIFDELNESETQQSVNEKVQKRILEEQKFWDPWYWKSEPYFNNEEKKKIFDELNESEEQVKDDGCELKKRTSRVTSKPISTQRAISQGMPMMPAPGWKTTWGINEAGVPEVSLKYEF